MGVPVNPHPSDEDLEWLYPSCLLYGKESFRAFRLIANYRYKWYVAKSNYVAMKIFLTGRKRRTRYLLFTYVGVHFSSKMMDSRDT